MNPFLSTNYLSTLTFLSVRELAVVEENMGESELSCSHSSLPPLLFYRVSLLELALYTRIASNSEFLLTEC